MKLKNYFLGLLLSLQFFTIVPLKGFITMDEPVIRKAVLMFPVVGLLIGGMNGLLFFTLEEWTILSNLAIAFAVWLIPILLTGGIHLDGWMDTSDAYFSYQDKEKRLDIMKDPRAGAFSVISVIVLLSARFLFIYESIELEVVYLAFIIALIPFFSRILMGFLMVTVQPAKEEGMAHFFRKHTGLRMLWEYFIILLVAGAVLLAIHIETAAIFLVFTVVTLLAAFWIKRKVIHTFGGITGDTLGASVEGVEMILWMVVWLSVYIGMV